jgi:hypothetical protein
LNDKLAGGQIGKWTAYALLFVGLGCASHVGGLACLSSAAAQTVARRPANKDVPEHARICVHTNPQDPGTDRYIVSKEKLAEYFVDLHPLTQAFMNAAITQAAQNPSFALNPSKISGILSDPRPCNWKQVAQCMSNDRKSTNDTKDTLSKDAKALTAIERSFADFLQEGMTAGSYKTANIFMNPQDFFSSTGRAEIACTKIDMSPVKDESAPMKDKSAVRLRGVADDLYIDRNRLTDAFKATSQATITATANNTPIKTENTKISAVIGYAFENPFDSSGLGEIIPYVSASESLIDTQLKPRSYDVANNWAAGMLASYTMQTDLSSHYFIMKPQYVVDTTQRSEIAEARFIYAPWTSLPGPINLNSPFPFYVFPVDTRAQLLFDLRSDIGTYALRRDPAYLAANQDFGRAGTKAGFSITTVNPDVTSLTSLTLIVTETLMYGWSGTVRDFNLFETSLTWNLDPNAYFGVKASYKNGFDEDTNARVQSWTVGFTARY